MFGTENKHGSEVHKNCTWMDYLEMDWLSWDRLEHREPRKQILAKHLQAKGPNSEVLGH